MLICLHVLILDWWTNLFNSKKRSTMWLIVKINRKPLMRMIIFLFSRNIRLISSPCHVAIEKKKNGRDGQNRALFSSNNLEKYSDKLKISKTGSKLESHISPLYYIFNCSSPYKTGDPTSTHLGNFGAIFRCSHQQQYSEIFKCDWLREFWSSFTCLHEDTFTELHALSWSQAQMDLSLELTAAPPAESIVSTCGGSEDLAGGGFDNAPHPQVSSMTSIAIWALSWMSTFVPSDIMRHYCPWSLASFDATSLSTFPLSSPMDG
jgi:hypothetical protein